MNGDLNTLPRPSDDEALELVKSVLLENPHWLTEDSDLNALARRAGGNVVDLEAARVAQIQERARRMADTHQAIVETARANLAVQSQVHAVVLTLMSAESAEEADERLSWMLRGALGVDCAKVLVEDLPVSDGASIMSAEVGLIESTIGVSRWERLGRMGRGARVIFGDDTDRLRSEAIIRLDINGRRGLMALGSLDPETFREDNGTELLNFLARVLERRLGEWLSR